jgi:outer membrane protein assembly factor BamB
MKRKHLLIVSTFLFFSLFVSACSSAIYASTGWYGLSASTDTAFLAAGGQVFAVDLSTHNQKWVFPQKANSKGFYANPVLTSDGQVLLPSYDNNLYSVDVTTGTQKWVFPQSGATNGSKNRLIGSPLVMNNTIYQPSSDGHIYALDLSGMLKWAAPSSGTLGPLWATPTTASNCGCIYVSSLDHYIYKYDANTGSQIAKSEDLGGAIAGTAAVGSDGTLYVGTFGKEMLALDGTSLAIKWRIPTHDWVWSGPSLANNVLYFGDLSGFFYALNAADGKALFSELQVNSPIVDTPLVNNTQIYFTAEADTIYIADTAGSLTSKVVGGQIYTSPVLAGDTILVAPTGFSSTLVALSLDGTQKWAFPPPK